MRHKTYVGVKCTTKIAQSLGEGNQVLYTVVQLLYYMKSGIMLFECRLLFNIVLEIVSSGIKNRYRESKHEVWKGRNKTAYIHRTHNHLCRKS